MQKLSEHCLSLRNSTCLKTPQYYFKECRLKPCIANNVDKPFARARRLKPSPRKASSGSVPGRREMHVLISQQLLRIIYILCQKQQFFSGTFPIFEKRAFIKKDRQ